jgi:hypothetical protein
MNGCHHCTTMAPEWMKVKQNQNLANLLMMTEMEASEQAVRSQNIQGFPALRVYPEGTLSPNYIEYKGPRTAEAIEDWALTGLGVRPAAGPTPQ